MILDEIIRKTGKEEWTVFSHKGKRLGSYPSLKAARKRLHQIEYFKSMKEDAEAKVTRADRDEAIQRLKSLLHGMSMKEIVAGFEDEKEHDDGSKVDVIKGSRKDRSEKLLKIVLAHLKEKPDYYTRLKKAMK